MSHDSTAHLSEEALNDILIGLGAPEAEEHLAFCPACRAKCEEFHAGMRAFNESSLAWSEARAGAVARPAVRTSARRIPIAALGLALAAMLLVAIAAPLWHHFNSSFFGTSSAGVVAPSISASGDSEAQIAEDNELMRSVDVALNGDAVAPLNPYGVSPYGFSQRPRPHLKARRKRGTD